MTREKISGRRIWCAIIARTSGRAVTFVAVFGFALAAGSISAKRSQAQEPARGEDTSGFIFHAVEDGNFAGQSTQPPQLAVETIDTESFLAELDARGISLVEPRGATESRSPIPSPEEATRDRRQFVLDHSDALPRDQLVDMIIALRDVPFAELAMLKGMPTGQRANVLADRKREIREAQADFAEYATEHGARITQSMWLANHLRMRVPASEVARVLSHDDVIDVHVALRRGVADYDGYDGQETRAQTFLQRFVDDGFDGEWGGRVNTQYGGNAIKVAVIEAWDSTWINPDDVQAPPEPNWINDTHPGWKDSNGISRLRGNYVCNGACVPAPSSSNASHGTTAAMIVAGDLTENQDPNCRDADDVPCGSMGEEKRTGVAKKASILYFRTRDDVDISAAIFQATVMGADIVNLSQSIPPCGRGILCPALECKVERNDGAMNEWIRIATDAGVLVVGSGERVDAQHVDVVGDDGDGAGRDRRCNGAAGIGQDQELRAERFQRADHRGERRRAGALIDMHASLQADDRHPSQTAQDQPATMACHGGARKARKLGIRDRRSTLEPISEAAEARSEDDRNLGKGLGEPLAQHVCGILRLVRCDRRSAQRQWTKRHRQELADGR